MPAPGPEAKPTAVRAPGRGTDATAAGLCGLSLPATPSPQPPVAQVKPEVRRSGDPQTWFVAHELYISLWGSNPTRSLTLGVRATRDLVVGLLFIFFQCLY